MFNKCYRPLNLVYFLNVTSGCWFLIIIMYCHFMEYLIFKMVRMVCLHEKQFINHCRYINILENPFQNLLQH